MLLLRLQLSQSMDIEVVGEATDGEAALARCHQLHPDAVVMDLLMPVANGFWAIERLRSEMPDIHIVAYTAVAGDYVRAEMERHHVPLVLKRGDTSALVAALRAGRPQSS